MGEIKAVIWSLTVVVTVTAGCPGVALATTTTDPASAGGTASALVFDEASLLVLGAGLYFLGRFANRKRRGR